MSTVKAKYFHLAKLYHPDKHLNSSEILKRQAEAYLLISKAYCGLIRVLGMMLLQKVPKYIHKNPVRRFWYEFFLLICTALIFHSIPFA